jgi:hypothetical protein
MNGFGFIEYEDAMDARDVVPGNYSTPTLQKPKLTLSKLSVRYNIETSSSTAPSPQHTTNTSSNTPHRWL